MPEAFIYDAVRTPRGKGKPDGALHEVPTVRLAAITLEAIRDRNGLDTHLVDDVILGCVDPIGEAGGDVARAAVFAADYGAHVPGMQINRFCASGLDAVNMAAAQVMTGYHDMVVAGGVESMSRVGIGASGGAWPVDPQVAVPSYFMPQGISADLIATKYGISRDALRRLCGGEPEAHGGGVGRRPLREIRRAGHRHQRPHHPRPRRASAARHQHAGARRAEAVVRDHRPDGRLRRRRRAGASRRGEGEPRPPCRQFVRHRRRRRRGAGRQCGGRRGGRPEGARKNTRLRQYRLRPGADADRPHRRDAEGA